MVLAILRTWSSECQCLVWDLYRWDNGRTIAHVEAGQRIEVVTNVEAGPPTMDQVILFAVAPQSLAMPDDDEESHGLLECLIHGSPEAEPGADLKAYASAVQECLPVGVTIVPQFFGRE